MINRPLKGSDPLYLDIFSNVRGFIQETYHKQHYKITGANGQVDWVHQRRVYFTIERVYLQKVGLNVTKQNSVMPEVSSAKLKCVIDADTYSSVDESKEAVSKGCSMGEVNSVAMVWRNIFQYIPNSVTVYQVAQGD